MYVPPFARKECPPGAATPTVITNLCDEFLHVDETPEARVAQVCACSRACARKSVSCIARLTDEAGREVYARVYKNRALFGHARVHAEMLMIHDNEVATALARGHTLTLYLTYQPCHFSGGHGQRHRATRLSCTMALIRFFERHMQPLGVQLVVRFSYIYRAHWETADRKYDEMIANARVGIQLLSRIATLRVMDEIDYSVLYRFCDESEQEKWDAGAYREVLAARARLNPFLCEVLDRITRMQATSSPCRSRCNAHIAK